MVFIFFLLNVWFKKLNKIGFFKIDFFIRVGDGRFKVNVENGKDVRDVY